MDHDHYWSTGITALKPYIPGEQPATNAVEWVKLNTNENPYPPSPRVLAALHAAVTESLRLYPDPESHGLKHALARHFKLEPTQVFVGNGSDEVLAHVFLGLLKHDWPILFPDVSYSFYPVYSQLYGIDYQTVPVAADFSLDLALYQRPNGGIIFPNPNAPTGQLVAIAALKQLLEKNTESVVVVDEAYIDFGGESAVPLIAQYPQLLVVQTFSKSRALAGLRVGYALGQAHLIEALQRVKNSFNSYPLDRLAQAGAVAALEDTLYFEQTRYRIIQSREQVVAALQAMGFQGGVSYANFIFVTHPQYPAALLFQQLRERGIMVRYFKQPRIDNYLRITIGTDMQCQRLLHALELVMEGMQREIHEGSL